MRGRCTVHHRHLPKVDKILCKLTPVQGQNLWPWPTATCSPKVIRLKNLSTFGLGVGIFDTKFFWIKAGICSLDRYLLSRCRVSGKGSRLTLERERESEAIARARERMRERE